MRIERWWNPNLPQMLGIACFLLYFDAAFGLLGSLATGSLLGLVLAVAAAAAAVGIANERRWGWKLAVAVSAFALLPFVLLIVDEGVGELLRPAVLLRAAFPVAQFALLVHPESRSHQKVWFN